jgi:hypothetical protein
MLMPRLGRRITQRHLQQQGHQKRQGATAQAGEEVAQNAHGEGPRAKQRRREQGVLDAPGPQPVSGEAGHADEQQQHHPHVRQLQLAEAFHGDGDQHHRRAEQQEADAIEARARTAAQVRHHFPHRPAAQRADRQVDQKNPVPAQVLDHPATEGGAEQRAEQAGNGDEAENPHQFAARVGAQHHQPPYRQHQRAAQALDHPRADQHVQRPRQRAQQRAEAEHQDGAEKHLLGAEAVGDPAGGGNQQGHGEHVGDDHALHAQGVFRQVAGHGRQRGVEDGAVERLHEKGNRHYPRQPASGTSVEYGSVRHWALCGCGMVMTAS